MGRVVIIGAGLTGLSTAYHLEQAGFFDYIILEKEAELGGLCRSVQRDGFIFDYTGHLLHINDQYVRELVTKFVGLDQFNYLQRSSFIYSHNTYTLYPFQINLHGLPVSVIADCVSGFVQRKKINNPKTFYSWVLTHFGRGFADHFFVPYQQKQFCMAPTQFSAQWTGRFVPQTSLEDIIRGAINDQQESIGYNAHFYYPKHTGISLLPRTLAKQLINPILTHHEVKIIDLKKNIITCTNGAQYEFDTLVNTMPLNQLLKKTIDTSATDFAHHHHKLKASSVLNINLGIKKKIEPDKHWIYTPEKEFSFYRLGFPHNFSTATAPAGCSSVYLECAYRDTYDRTLVEQAINKSCELLGLTRADIASTTILELPVAYALYTPWRDQNIDKLLARLHEVGIYSIGRYGSWKYAAMQEALLDGQHTAQTIMHMQQPYLTNQARAKQPTM